MGEDLLKILDGALGGTILVEEVEETEPLDGCSESNIHGLSHEGGFGKAEGQLYVDLRAGIVVVDEGSNPIDHFT